MDSLSGIAVFVQVVDAKSFTAAARLLGVSSSAVGKSIARMEERLAVQLFHRSTRRVKLTAQGALFLQRCRNILREIEAAQNELLQTAAAPRARLRISLPQLSCLLLPALNDFMRVHPDVGLDIDLSERIVDVDKEGFDLVIREGRLDDERLDSRPLWHGKQVLVAAPDYLARRGIPSTTAELGAHCCLMHNSSPNGPLQRWPLCDDGADKLCLPETLTSTTMEAIAYMAEQGRGIAFVPEYMVRESLKAGRLRHILPGQVQRTLMISMLWPSGRFPSSRLSGFIDYLAEHLPDREGVRTDCAGG